ncbi:MAG: hypothetical protein ABJ387_03455 [Balneola sp.]
MSESENTKKMYSPIDGQPDERFPLLKTSKGNIKALANVCSKRIRSEDADRANWAEQAGHTPAEWIEIKTDKKTKKLEQYLSAEEKKKAVIVTSRRPVFDVVDVYTEYYIHAALAPVLFDGFPEILNVRMKQGVPVVTITNEDLFENLLEDVVNEAFLDFAGKRNPTSKLLKEYLNQSGSSLSNLLGMSDS